MKGRLPTAARLARQASTPLAAADPSTAARILLVGPYGVAVKPIVSGAFEVDVMAEIPLGMVLAGGATWRARSAIPPRRRGAPTRA